MLKWPLVIDSKNSTSRFFSSLSGILLKIDRLLLGLLFQLIGYSRFWKSI